MTPFEHSLLDRLRNAVALHWVTQKEIESATDVDQSQISRILKGQCKRSSENVQRLCKFAQELPGMAPGDSDPTESEAYELLAALLQGPSESRQSVVHLLRNFLALKRQYENNGRA